MHFEGNWVKDREVNEKPDKIIPELSVVRYIVQVWPDLLLCEGRSLV